MCQQQAEELEKLKTSYQNPGKTDIKFLIVNHVRGKASIGELTRRVSFPVYQDDNTLHIQGKLNASTEDLLVYDRCGTLTYHLRKSKGMVTQGTIQILSTYTDNPCNCTSDALSKVEDKPKRDTAAQQDKSLTAIIRRRRHVASSSGSSLISMNRAAVSYGRVPK